MADRTHMEAAADPGEAHTLFLRLRAPAARLPIGARLLPPWQRKKLVAIQQFAALTRLIADDDEQLDGVDSPAREALLDALEDDVDLIAGHHRPHHRDVRPLRRIVRHGHVPMALLHKLIAAARQDLYTTRYARYEDLVGYCTLSGGAVGELVAAALSRKPVGLVRHDDVAALYTAARILVLCSSVHEDARRGRVYLPQADLQVMRAREQDLTATPLTHALRGTIQTQVRRAGYQLQALRQGLRGLPLFTRIAVAGTYAEACVLVDTLERIGFDASPGPLPMHRAVRQRAFARALLGR